jgi:hypothetical protein
MASFASAAPTEPGCNPLPSLARAHATGGGRVHFVQPAAESPDAASREEGAAGDDRAQRLANRSLLNATESSQFDCRVPFQSTNPLSGKSTDDQPPVVPYQTLIGAVKPYG